MKEKYRKFTKTLLKAAAIIPLFLCLAIAICINVFFSPEKLTPILLNTANQQLNGHIELEKAELTFFSSFPRLGVRLSNGKVVSNVSRDSLFQRQDTLISFKKADVIINPFDFLINNRLNVHLIELDSAQLYAFKAKNGIANWDLTQPDTLQSTDDNTSNPVWNIGEIDVNRIALKNTQLTFDDRETGIFSKLWNLDLTIKAKIKEGYSLLAVNFSNSNLLFWQNNQLMAHDIAMKFNTEIEWESKRKLLSLHDAMININGVSMDAKGTIQLNTLPKTLNIDLSYALHAPSVKKLLHMIPESILKKEEVTAQGEVFVGGTIQGMYGKNQLPAVTLEAKIDKASLKYSQMPYGVDECAAQLSGIIDLNRKKDSYIDLNILRLKGGNTDIFASARVSHLFSDPLLHFHTQSTIDLRTLSEIFPFQNGISLSGILNANMDINCKWSSIQKNDWGRVRTKGKLDLQRVSVNDSIQQFTFTGDALLSFKGDKQLEASAKIVNLQIQSPNLESSISSMTADIQSTLPKDTTQIADVACKVALEKLKTQKDSTRIFCGQSKAKILLGPTSQQMNQPQIDFTLETDTLFYLTAGNSIGLDRAGIRLKAIRSNDTTWMPKGVVGFNKLQIRSTACSLPIQMQKTAVSINGHTIRLHKAAMQVGQSDFSATGEMYNLYQAIRHQQLLQAKLDLTSNYLNCNELIRALSCTQDSATAEKDTTSTGLSLFVIPQNIDFELHTQLNQVDYERTRFEEVNGTIDIHNQAIHLQSLRMKGLGANINTTLVYQAQEKRKGYTGFDFDLSQIDISKLVDFLPSLDTIVPMLRSFEGRVDFHAAAETQLDSCLNIQIPTLRAAIHLKGDSLVLMDGETFAEISKKFLFKNKKRNRIDHISANISVKNGDVTIYPFEIAMDRYRAAIGGTQGLDMNFNYHISILKSPVPFKLGLNITGNLDNMKFRLGKARYKDAVTPVEIHKVDSTIVNMSEQITRRFKKILKRNAHPQTH